MEAVKHASRSPSGALRVMVTGGTGFVGFHTARALHEAGHSVRLLVRSADKMQRVLAPFGLATLDHVQGDIADPGSVAQALDGCDAVVHAAAMVDVHAKNALETIRNNRRGTELVIGGAVERGIERIVQVSSSTALFDPGVSVIGEDSPLGTQGVGYGRSKIESDLFVRGLQARGACVYTTYPGSVMGPDDPGLSEAMIGLQATLNEACIITSSGIQILDVRDLALAHVRLIERGGPPARYAMGGHYFRWAEFAALLESVVGASLWRVPIPGQILQALGFLGDVVNRVVPFDLPLSYEAAWYASEWTPSDDSRVQRDLAFSYRDIRETLGDAIVWLADKGHLKRAEYAVHIRKQRRRAQRGQSGHAKTARSDRGVSGPPRRLRACSSPGAGAS